MAIDDWRWARRADFPNSNFIIRNSLWSVCKNFSPTPAWPPAGPASNIILYGRVSVNGQPVRLLGTKIDPDHDRVAVDGKFVRAKKLIYIALNKPVGCVCSRQDELNRPTIYELLPREWDTVQSVGRLDYNSEGLIFLTNDGQFALRLTHPRYGVRKKYLATVEGEVTPAMLQLFKQGIFHEGSNT